MRMRTAIAAVLALCAAGIASAAAYRLDLGVHADDATALTYLQAREWDTNADGTGNPQEGMHYWDSDGDKTRRWNGAAWEDVSAADVAVDASGFSGLLSGSDTDVQTMATTIDGLSVSGAGTAVITPSMTTPVADIYEHYSPAGGGTFLRLERRTDFPVARSIAQADSEYGYTWDNRARSATGSDENTSVSDAAHWEHDATASIWNATGTHTAPRRYVDYEYAHGDSVEVIARVASNCQADTEAAGIGIFETGDANDFIRAEVAYASGSLKVRSVIDGGFSTSVITSGQRDAGVWLRVLLKESTDVAIFYSVETETDPDNVTWTKLADDANWGDNVDAVEIGQMVFENNTNATLEVDYLYYDAQAYRPAGTTSEYRVPWSATQYDTNATVQVVVQDYPVGSLEPNLAILRQVLADSENTLPGDAAAITWDVVLDSGTGNNCSTYQSAASLTIDGSGSTMDICAKMTSAGSVGGSIDYGALRIPLE